MSDQLSALKKAYLALEKMEAKVRNLEQASREPIAIIGMGCRFPGDSNGPEAFWQFLKNGTDAVREVPTDRWDVNAYYDSNPDAAGKMLTRNGAFLNGIDQFDPQFFGIAPREAASMDPQQRLLLEVAWEALENAGQAPDKLSGSRTGVFLGIINSDYRQLALETHGIANIDSYYSSGVAQSVASGRISYVLGLQGPSVSVDTACSSSLVAVHLACQSLRTKESRMALAGGVNLILTPELSIAFSKYQMLAADGKCKTFDSRADGFGRGEGCGLIVLKRLSDALADRDHIHALILGTAVNQDGPSSGLTAPNGPAQESVVRDALANAGLKPSEVTYIEAHGTGTSLGDPIEVQALGSVFAERSKDKPLFIGSVKTNMGHLEGAAGIAGLIKAALALKHRSIPAHLHFEEPSPFIPWADLRVKVPTQLTAWPADASLNAGISAFGFSGTNAHVILGAAPLSQEQTAENKRPVSLVKLSSKSESTLRELAHKLEDHLTTTPDTSLPDAFFSANVGRADLSHRLTLIAESKEQVIEKLTSFAASHTGEEKIPGVIAGQIQSIDQPKIAFLFTGQGSQYPGMGKQLYQTQPVFQQTVERCAEILKAHMGISILDILFSEDETSTQINNTANAQPALFTLEYALAELWRSWGIQPSLVMGHSVGEYVAACVAGVFSLEDGLKLIAARGRLMQSLPGGGQMAAIFSDTERVSKALESVKDQVNIAAFNGPNNIVISGFGEAVRAVSKHFTDEGIKSRALSVSHAFHSPAMEPILSEFEKIAQEIKYASPKIKLISNLTGQVAMGTVVARAAYWCDHIRQPVQFEAGMKTTHAQGTSIYLEIGPDPILLGMGQNCITESARKSLWLPSLRKGRADWQTILQSLGEMYVYGTNVDWAGFEESNGQKGRRLPLPTTPFDRKRYWIAEKPQRKTTRATSASDLHPLLGQRLRSALKDTQFESQVGIDSLSFLNDHRLYGFAILPGTTYIELGLAVSKLLFEQKNHIIKDLVIREPLIANSDADQTLQVIVSPAQHGSASYNVFSSPTAKSDSDWSLHATGTISTESKVENIPLSDSPQAIQKRCSKEVTADEHYQTLRELGLEFGPSLHGVERIWRGPDGGEALGQIRLPESLSAETGAYVIHPALLDACLQVLAQAIPVQNRTDIYMPLSLDSIKVYGSVDNQLWSHATVDLSRVREGQETYNAAVHIVDDYGRVLAAIEGIRLKRASKAALMKLASHTSTSADWLYQVRWQPSLLPASESTIGFASPSEIAGHIQPSLSDFARKDGMAEYQELLPQLNIWSSDAILAALQKLGWEAQPHQEFTSEALVHELRLRDSYCALIERFLGILFEDGYLGRNGSSWMVQSRSEKVDLQQLEKRGAAFLRQYPMFEAEVTLLVNCGLALAEILTGRKDPLELLFPGGDLSTPEKLYRESPLSKAYNGLARAAILKALEEFPATKPLRVLEIGAGTGGTTSYLVPELNGRPVEYVFTDMSMAFLTKARRKFSEFSFLDYRILNIEQNPQSQGFESQHYDLIVAANVIHATSDLRKTLSNVQGLLAPNGLFMMLEVTSFVRWIDLTFGLTDGWWRFTDNEIRSSYPLLSQGMWQKLLSEIGFVQTASVPSAADSGLDQTMILARNAAASESQEKPKNWLIFADAAGIGSKLAALLREKGDRCVLVSVGKQFENNSSDQYSIDPISPQDIGRLFTEVSTSWHGIVHLWNVDAPATETMDLSALNDSQIRNSGTALYLVQALTKLRQEEHPRLWLVTRGAVPATKGNLLSMAQTPAFGLGKVIALEHPELQCTCIDVESGDADQVQRLYSEIVSGSRDDQVALHNQRYVARLAKYAPEQIQKSSQNEPVRLTVTQRGTFENLVLEPVMRRDPAAGEVEIRVQATGLNFRDVLNVLDMYPGDPGPLGGECAGEVVAVGSGVAEFKVGEKVMGLASDCFRSYVLAPVNMIAHKPAHLSFEEAATMLIPYMTAYFTMRHLGKMREGEKILIHAAAGGVGLAAVKLALHAGTEVFATVGSAEKRAYLQTLGVKHILDSRSLNFADEIMKLTQGTGVDLVLNSLADEFCMKSLSVLGKNGRFLEIGTRGILSSTEVARLRPDVSYFIVDWSETFRSEPDLMHSLLGELVTRIEDKTFTSLPLRRFTLENAVDAFRYMTKAKHIGKIVITQERGSSTTSVFQADATYLITGGLRGLGLVVAKWMVAKGARHLVLLGRNVPDSAAHQSIQEMEQAGAEIVVAQADVSVADKVNEVFQKIKKDLPPLRGVIHAAGVLADGMLINQDWFNFAKVFAPKVQGTWHLHELTKNMSLDFFVMFSSVASLLGSRGQANHAAANMFMDQLAYYRQTQGLPALSINWGAWSQIGAAVDYGVADRISKQGVSTFTPEEGLQTLEYLLGQKAPQVGVMPINWAVFMKQYRTGTEPVFFADMVSRAQTKIEPKEGQDEKRIDLLLQLQQAPASKRQPMLIAYIQSQVSKVLGLDSGQKVNEDLPLSEMGLDSLMAVEVRNILGAELSLKRALPATLVYDYPTVSAIAAYIMTEMDLITVEEQPSSRSQKDVPVNASMLSMLDALEDLSDEDVDRMLAAQMKEGKSNNE